MKNTLFFLFIIFCTAAAAQAQTADTTKVDTRTMCKATTKAGTPCKHHAKTPAAFCTIHNPETPKCGAVTKSGAPCKRTVKASGQHCAVHNSTAKQ